MRAKETARMVGGSIAVYVIVAACSAASGPNGSAPGGQAQGDGSSGGGSSGSAADDGASGGAIDDGSGSGAAHDGTASDSANILDALTDPVPKAGADTTQSGTRLKASYYVGSDGSKTFFTMHDSQLNVDCGFVTASDGTTRCMPLANAVNVGQFFSDSGCSQALAYTSTACSTTTHYAIQYLSNSGGCGYSYHAYTVSGAFAGTVYNGTPSSCTALSSAADASAYSRDLATAFSTYSFYAIGSELPPSTFVQATVQTDP